MKATLVIGDTLDFVTAVPDHPASAGYTLKYRLVPRVSGTPIVLTATTSGSDFRVQVPAATTATWTPGEYTWSGWVEKSGERITVDSGVCTLQYDPATIAAYDGRSQARIALEAALAAMATAGSIKRYSINGREVEYLPASELAKRISDLQAQVNLEDRAEALRRGQPDPRRVYIRMSNA